MHRSLRLASVLASFVAFGWLASGVAAADSDARTGTFSPAFSSFFGTESVTGGWRIVEESGVRILELDDDFRASEAPDLKLFLSPLTPDAVTGDNATDGSVRLGLLTSFEGRARYEIPADADLASLRSLVLHCEAYSKLWGTSTLR